MGIGRIIEGLGGNQPWTIAKRDIRVDVHGYEEGGREVVRGVLEEVKGTK